MPSDPRNRDLEDRLRAGLDGLDAPDLWPEANRVPRPNPAEAQSWSAARMAAMAVGLIVFVFSLGVLFQLRTGGGSTPTIETPAAESISSSAMLSKTAGVRCTASMSSVLEPGQAVDLSYTLENTSSDPVPVGTAGYAFPMQVTAGDGSRWDTQDLMNHSYPYIPPTKLQPGDTKMVSADTSLFVQFPGPITVTPTCEGEKLPSLDATVSSSGSAPDASDAIARAASATSGLFDHCMPGPDAPADGTIEPPPGSNVSGFEAKCSADVARYDGFSVVTFIVMSPPDTPVPDLGQGLGIFSGWPNFPENTNQEMIVWRFVVPSNGDAIPVGSSTKVSSQAAGDATEAWYDLKPSGWSDGGSSRCGGQGGGGGSWNGASVVFLSACN